MEITKVSVLFLTKDLVFSSRVAGVAQSRQIELSVVSEADQLLTNTSANQVKLVLLDLTTSRCDPKQLVPSYDGLRARRKPSSPLGRTSTRQNSPPRKKPDAIKSCRAVNSTIA